MTEAGTHSQIDYIISSSTTSHLYQNTEYEEELLSDHKGISVRSPLLFPEFHTQSTKKFILDWRTFDNWAYKFISETELDTAVSSGNWHDQSIEGKIELFTNIQKFSLQNTIQLKETSSRGNTKPRWLVSLIKNKRRIQNGLRILSSDTRIRAENLALLNLPIPQNPQKTQLSEYLFQYLTKNQNRFKKETHHIGRRIIRHQIQLKKEGWIEAVNKLANTDIKKAPREFYSTFKKLGGLGRNTSHITKMEYNNTIAQTEPYVANLMAKYVEDSFQPLNEPDFDY